MEFAEESILLGFMGKFCLGDGLGLVKYFFVAVTYFHCSPIKKEEMPDLNNLLS